MELRTLRYFLAVAEELHFTRAAERLNISQPPLTKHIQQLEAEIGAALFERTKRSVRLTEVGTAFVPEARRLLAQHEVALRVVDRLKKGEVGRVRIAFVPAVIFMDIDTLVRRVEDTLPGVVTTWEEMTTVEQVEALSQDRIDLGFVQAPHDIGSMRCQVVARVPLVAALSSTHPLAGARQISLGRLRDDSFIVIPREIAPGFHDLVTATCMSAGFSPSVRHHAKHMLSIVSLVALGRGVALVPQTLARASLPGVVFKPLRDLRADADYSVLWNPVNQSHALTTLLGLLPSL